MSQIVERTKRHNWRRNTYLWMLSALVVVSALIYWEQTALLYALSTLAMCVLLVVVAFSDLEGRDRELNQPVESDRPRMTESNVTTGLSPSVSADPQAVKRRKGAA
ncbi:MAG: hypothetical protein ACRD8U_20095 [Pyrinomonadaceae bacterium]